MYILNKDSDFFLTKLSHMSDTQLLVNHIPRKCDGIKILYYFLNCRLPGREHKIERKSIVKLQ